ncbi:MAG: hypothetical protein DRP57_00470 [Spirochaetes bacterium]|nr:MAG: hypothetical protein DRP57_00470 [Spirochaetota bacterium]
MKGIELSRHYYKRVVMPAFSKRYRPFINSMAFGLIGPGSECYGYGPVKGFDGKSQRDGITSVPAFFKRFLGFNRLHNTIKEWLSIKEEMLSVCTNGEVFDDFKADLPPFL